MSNLQKQVSWKKQPKTFLFNLYVNIYKLLPDSDDTISIKNQLKHCLTNLSIKAPEIVGESWVDIFNTLQKYVILKGEFKENSQWKQDIFNLYHEQYQLAVKEQTNYDSDDDNGDNDNDGDGDGDNDDSDDDNGNGNGNDGDDDNGNDGDEENKEEKNKMYNDIISNNRILHTLYQIDETTKC